MAYQPYTWKNKELITAEKLNRMEQGIAEGGGDGTGVGVTAANIKAALGYTPADSKDIPTVPEALKNPNALTIKIGSTTVTYDGSSAQTVEIADGTEVSY